MLFPLYGICDSADKEPGLQIGNVSGWAIIDLDDGSPALLVFDSVEKAAAVCGGDLRSVAMIDNAYQFARLLGDSNGIGQPTKVCGNYKPDGRYDWEITIPAMLELLKNLPPEAKGS